MSAPPGPAATKEAFAPAAFVAAAAVCLLYSFLFGQSAAAFGEFSRLVSEAKARGEKPPKLNDVKYGGGKFSRVVLAADRTAGNYMEQLVPFLIIMFGHAAFVDANWAAVYGWIWLFFRSYYPIVYNYPFPALFLSTLPSYSIVWWMLFVTVRELA